MEIDWTNVKRILVVKLRSIGDTVLATPSLTALRRHLPHAQIDILLEDWVAPLLEGFDDIDNILTVGRDTTSRLRAAASIRRRKYDAVFNLHGGTTSTWFARATGARYRIGFEEYQYSFLYTHSSPPPSVFWGRDNIHSAEQQLALLGSVGIPVEDLPLSRLVVAPRAFEGLEAKLRGLGFDASKPFAVIHPAAAFDPKRWAKEKFAAVVDDLFRNGLNSMIVGSSGDVEYLRSVAELCSVPVWHSGRFDLAETTALVSRASLFVGNDSGVAHMAAALKVPLVVIFGSMDRTVWRPWTDSPNEMVFEEFACQPCPGYECKVFGEPRCILTIRPESVIGAIEKVLR